MTTIAHDHQLTIPGFEPSGTDANAASGVLTLEEFRQCATPEDAYFKKSLSLAAPLAALIQYLMPEIAGELDTARAEVVVPVFIRPDLRERRADLFVRVPIRLFPDLFLYILFEHKSYVDMWVALQICQYVTLAHEKLLETAKEKGVLLPPIELFLIYTGAQHWTAPVNYKGVIDPRCPSLNRHVGFDFAMVQLRQIPDAELENLGQLGVVLLALKHGRTLSQSRGALETILRMLEAYGCEFADLTVSFLILVCEDQFKDIILARARSLVVKELSMSRTIADALRDEGRAEGEAKGRAEGREEGKEEGWVEGRLGGKGESLLLLLAHRFAAVPAAIENRIQHAKEAQINAWLCRILFARNMDEVFAEGQI